MSDYLMKINVVDLDYPINDMLCHLSLKINEVIHVGKTHVGVWLS